MVKSDARKAILTMIEKTVGTEKFRDEFVLLDTLEVNAKKNFHVACSSDGFTHGDPISVSIADGSVKLFQFMSANSLPSKKETFIQDFENEQNITISLDEDGSSSPKDSEDLWDDSLFPDLTGYEGPHGSIATGKYTFVSEAKYARATSLEHSLNETWFGLGNFFVYHIISELERLSPFSVDQTKRAIKGWHHCSRHLIAPIVVIGFDKGSEQIKDETHEKRQKQTADTLEKQRKKDLEWGFTTRRGLPLSWEEVDSKRFNPKTTKLPYPPQEALTGDCRRILIRFITKFIIHQVRTGALQYRILSRTAKKRQHRLFQITLDGHCLYPGDDEELLQKFNLGEFGNTDDIEEKRKELKKKPNESLPHGSDSPFVNTPISIFVLFDEEDYIFRFLNQLIPCPDCETGPLNANFKENSFCNDGCPRLSLFKRRVQVYPNRPDSSSRANKHFKISPISTYSFIGADIPQKIIRFIQRVYPVSPLSTISFEPNNIGEFDFTSFEYLHNTLKHVHQQFNKLARRSFHPSCERKDQDLHLSFSARIMTNDTDSFILSMMAMEMLTEKFQATNLNIFLVNNHSAAARKFLSTDPKKSLEDKEQILSGHKRPDFQIYNMRAITQELKKLFPKTHYPASSLGMFLYFKENDYLSPSLKGISHQGMIDSLVCHYSRSGCDFLIDRNHHPKECLRITDDINNIPNAICLLNPFMFNTFFKNLDFHSRGSCAPTRFSSEANIKKYEITGKQRSFTVKFLPDPELRTRLNKLHYVTQLYCDSVLGRVGTNRTIPFHKAVDYGFVLH